MIRLRADWVVPIDRRPIRNGWIAVDDDRIVAIGTGDAVEAQAYGPVRSLGSVVLLPGLVNAHTHLELSWMERQVPPQARMSSWAASLLASSNSPGCPIWNAGA